MKAGVVFHRKWTWLTISRAQIGTSFAQILRSPLMPLCFLQVTDDIVNEFTALQAEADTQQISSLQILQNATNILTSAQQLYNSTNQVTI